MLFETQKGVNFDPIWFFYIFAILDSFLQYCNVIWLLLYCQKKSNNIRVGGHHYSPHRNGWQLSGTSKRKESEGREEKFYFIYSTKM